MNVGNDSAQVASTAVTWNAHEDKPGDFSNLKLTTWIARLIFVILGSANKNLSVRLTKILSILQYLSVMSNNFKVVLWRR